MLLKINRNLIHRFWLVQQNTFRTLILTIVHTWALVNPAVFSAHRIQLSFNYNRLFASAAQLSYCFYCIFYYTFYGNGQLSLQQSEICS